MSKKPSFKDRQLKTLSTIKSPGFKVGFSNIDMWASTPVYSMNRLWSGRWDRAFLFGRNYALYGESGSGKSYFCALAAADAQKKHNALIFWLDAEHANDDVEGKKWLERAGIDSENLIYMSVASLEQVKTIIAKTSNDYQLAMDNGEEDLQPIVFVVDSWAALLTEAQLERTLGKKAGEVVGDMGQKQKQTGDVINAITHLCVGKPILVLGVLHIMDNQDGYGRKHKLTGGHKILYFCSGALALTKKELRIEDIDSNVAKKGYEEKLENLTADGKKKASNIGGIISVMEILKSRVSKPFEKIEIQIPYNTGIDPYSGLFELLMQERVISIAAQGWYQYTNTKGELVKFRRSEFEKYADEMMVLADNDISSSEKETTEKELLLEGNE